LKRRNVAAALCVLAVGALLALPVPASQAVRGAIRDNLEPFRQAVVGLFRRIGEVASAFSESRRLLAENARLEREVAALEMAVGRWQASAAESVELRELLDFRRESSWRLLAGRVIARGDISGWWRTVTLDRGADGGAAVNLAVVTREGLVGRVTAVTARSCDVLLITDPASRVACRVPRTGGYGILEGGGAGARSGVGGVEMLCAPGPLEMNYIARDERTEPGFEVVTSGLGGVFPEGLRVGTVQRVWPDPSGLCQRAEVRPAARLDRLRNVFIVVGGVENP